MSDPHERKPTHEGRLTKPLHEQGELLKKLTEEQADFRRALLAFMKERGTPEMEHKETPHEHKERRQEHEGIAEARKGEEGELREHRKHPGTNGPFEHLIIRISEGRIHVQDGKDERKHFIFEGNLLKLDGAEDGHFEADYEAKFLTKYDLTNYPDDSTAPISGAAGQGEREWTPFLNPTRAKWVFHDGSELRAVGLALSRIADHRNDAPQWWYAPTSFITGGKGAYEGAVGQAVSLGSTYFDKVPTLNEGNIYPFSLIHVLKVLLREDRAPNG
jgi:hypothetical protein